MTVYESWIQDGLHGSMDYLKSHADLKANPLQLRPRVKSAIVVTQPYYPHPWPAEKGPRAGVAKYALGKDYHIHLKIGLRAAAEKLAEKFPGHEFHVFTDSAPILERDLAYRASLGWFGKNTCLMSREQGSLFLIAEILTTLEFEGEELPFQHDFCGTCTKCVEVCPTSALSENKKLDATRCISYWTIESAEPAPEELRPQLGGWVFGCDLCQTVCPWNLKVHGQQIAEPASRTEYLSDLGWILTTTSKQLQVQLKGTPLARAAGLKLKRNAMIAAANQALTELQEEIRAYENHDKLGEVARWSLNQLAKVRESGEVL